ncbi:hypothetical protein CFAM422_004101 [Trichoderma lentiforme]|uniref:Uncharacterized protein n=1 Tax=Trichoderma lentiforme TaxID=1567552 RepID=A0A9P4XJK6_9HYPO|nr:hypothetical protein CFAM422_004101 [Trichoderma lentiforme]
MALGSLGGSKGAEAEGWQRLDKLAQLLGGSVVVVIDRVELQMELIKPRRDAVMHALALSLRVLLVEPPVGSASPEPGAAHFWR